MESKTLPTQATTWMNLTEMTLSERSETQKNTQCVVSQTGNRAPRCQKPPEICGCLWWARGNNNWGAMMDTQHLPFHSPGAGCTAVLTLWQLNCSRNLCSFLHGIYILKITSGSKRTREISQDATGVARQEAVMVWTRGDVAKRGRSRLISGVFWCKTLVDLLMDWMLRWGKEGFNRGPWVCEPSIWADVEPLVQMRKTKKGTCTTQMPSHVTSFIFPNNLPCSLLFYPHFSERELRLSAVKLFAQAFLGLGGRRVERVSLRGSQAVLEPADWIQQPGFEACLHKEQPWASLSTSFFFICKAGIRAIPTATELMDVTGFKGARYMVPVSRL